MSKVIVSIQAELAENRLGLCMQVIALQKTVDYMLEDVKLAAIPILEGPIVEYFEKLESTGEDGLRIKTHLNMDLEIYTGDSPLIRKWRRNGFYISIP